MENAPAPNTTWPPDTKLVAGAVGFVVSWGLTTAVKYLGLDIPPDIMAPLQAGIVGVFTLGVVYIMPPSMRDIIRRVNNSVVAAAAKDPNNPTRAIVIPLTAPMGTEAAAQSAVHKEIAVSGVGLPP